MTLLDPSTDPELAPMPSHRMAPDPTSARPWYRRRWQGFPHWAWALFAVFLCLVVATVVILRDAAGDPTRTAAGAPIVPVTALPSTFTPPPAPGTSTGDLPEGAFAGDGHYRVGEEVAPGKYVAAGPSTPGVPGVWARCRIPAPPDGPPCGSEADVLDSGRSTGQPTVTLRAGQIFETRGFSEWRRA